MYTYFLEKVEIPLKRFDKKRNKTSEGKPIFIKILNEKKFDFKDKKRCNCCNLCGQIKYWCICEFIMN